MNKNISLFGVCTGAGTGEAITEVLQSGAIAYGRYVEEFSEEFKHLVEQNHVVTVNDMSNAIQIALRLSGVGCGDRVLASSFACMSTNAPIAGVGAVPVWVDVDPATGLIDPMAFRRSLTGNEKAAIVYHCAGYPAKIVEIANICKENGIVLIEDCDNALLATVNGRQVGTFGDFAVYSFYPNRQVNATEGGALACRRQSDADRGRKLRRYGIDIPRFRDEFGEIDPSCDITEIGYAATLNNLCSAIGLQQLSTVGKRIDYARFVADLYSEAFRGVDGIQIVAPERDSIPSYWAYLIRVRDRDNVLKRMKSLGIQVSKLHHRTDQYSGFGMHEKNLPATQDFLDHVLALPCGWWLKSHDIEHIAQKLIESVSLNS